jgi:hypothetical protein
LRLSDCSVTDNGLSHLSGLPELRELDLSGTEITGKAMAHLIGLRKLERLRLRGTRVRPEDLLQLAAIKSLDVLDPPVTPPWAEGLGSALWYNGPKNLPDGFAALRNRLPGLLLWGEYEVRCYLESLREYAESPKLSDENRLQVLEQLREIIARHPGLLKEKGHLDRGTEK